MERPKNYRVKVILCLIIVLLIFSTATVAVENTEDFAVHFPSVQSSYETLTTPNPYFPLDTLDDGLIIYYGTYGTISGFKIAKVIANGGGAGNVTYQVNGTHFPLKSLVFWMDAGEWVKVWTYYSGSNYPIMGDNIFLSVRAATPSDTSVSPGSFTVEPYTPSIEWLSPGGHTLSSVAMDAKYSTGEWFTVIRGMDNHIYFNRYADSTNTWTGWTPIGGTTYDEPAVAYTGNDYVHVVIRGTNNGLYYKKLNLDTNVWDPSWISLGGQTASAPALTSWTSSQTQVNGNPEVLPYLWLAVRGIDNHLYVKQWTPASGWDTAWQSWGGTTYDRPALALGANLDGSDARITLGVRGGDNRVYTRTQTVGGPLGSWTSPGGSTLSPPVIRYNDGVLQIVVRGMDNHVYHKEGSNSYSALGGTTFDSPAVFNWGDRWQLSVSVRGSDSKIYIKNLGLLDNSQTGWTDMEHTAASHPTLSAGTGSNGVLAIRGTDNGIYVHVV